MRASKKFSLVVFGYGYWGPNLVRNVLTHEGFELCGVIDLSEKARARCERQYPGVPTFASLDELLRRKRPDAAIVATPPASHVAIAKELASKGIHLLIEKPIATSIADCDEVLEAARSNGVELMVDHTFLHHPAVEYFLKSAQKGELGDLLYYDSVRVNFGGFQTGVDVLWDLGPHDLSIIDHLVGHALPTEVVAHGGKTANASTTTFCFVTLRYPNGLIARLHLSWIAPVKLRSILLGGTRRMVLYDENLPTEKVRVYDKQLVYSEEPEVRNKARVEYRVGDMIAPALPTTEALSRLIETFHGRLRAGAQPTEDGDLSRRIVAILTAASESMRADGKPVAVRLAPMPPARRTKGAA